ncbi:MAG: hydrogenase [Desulfobulbaceae bacterium]|jgi:hydrogenase-4 component E|nr:hydrogenase [Desulfobulbaceae bacterium]
MNSFADAILVAILLISLLSLASSRIVALVKLMALQGALVSLTPPMMAADATDGGVALFCLIMLAVKAALIPWLLALALTKVAIKNEVEPIIGYHASLAVGLIFMLVATHLTGKLGLPLSDGRGLALAAAFTTMASGLFLMMSRTKAITQVIGYLILENGIYLTGATLTRHSHSHYIVEFGILLDLLVAVMLMGIIVNNINRAFDDVDTSRLESLKD